MSKRTENIKKPSDTVLKSLKNDHRAWANKVGIQTLVNTLKYLSDAYYNTGKPLVSDKVFDELKTILEKRAPTNKFLQEVGAPIIKDAVLLPYPMASLDKIVNDPIKLEKWLAKYPGPYVLSDKLDGVSGSLTKKHSNKLEKDSNKLEKDAVLATLTKKGNDIKLHTRGDGTFGQDVSHLIKYIVPDEILNKLPDGIAIRGEIILSKENFEKIKTKHQLKNARNAVSGVVNAKHPNEEIVKLLEFIGYAVVNEEVKISKQLELLEKLNFPTVFWTTKTKLDNDILTKYLVNRKENGEYEIDGIVVMDDSKAYKLSKGNPDHGFAFKNNDALESAQVQVIKIEWNGSKDAYLVPTVIVEPIELEGVLITRATGHNAKFIKDNKLGPGAIINIIRSGSVIPHITDTIKGTVAQMPDIPTKDFKWSETGVDIIYTGKDKDILDEIATSYITFFFSKIGVKFLSEGIVSKLVENGYKTPIDIIDAGEEELYEIHGLGKKIIDKIYDNIDSAFDGIKLETIMSASNVFGRGLGSKKLALILKHYPNIINENWTEKVIADKVLEIKGFDVLTANRFAKNVKKFKEFYEELKKVVDIKLFKPKEKPTTKINKECNIFQGKTVVFTGFRSNETEEYIESCGGKVSSSVSKNTFMVVHADIDDIENNSKYKKAEELGIKLMGRKKFEDTYL